MKKALMLILCLILLLSSLFAIAETETDYWIRNANSIATIFQKIMLPAKLIDEIDVTPQNVSNESKKTIIKYTIALEKKEAATLDIVFKSLSKTAQLIFISSSEIIKTSYAKALALSLTNDFELVDLVNVLENSKLKYSSALTLYAAHGYFATIQYEVWKISDKEFQHTIRVLR